MLQAVKYRHLINWPGLTEDAIKKHLKLMPATAMGHMNQRRQNIKSTSKAKNEKQISPDADLGTKTHLVYAVGVDQGQLYTDLMGKFPVRSSKGNSYVMVCYIYDCNYIKFVPLKSRTASEWVKEYESIHQELIVKCFKPCPLAPRHSRPTTCIKTTSAVWMPPTWPSPLEITIGRNGTKPTAPSQRRHPPSHRQSNGMLGAHEGSTSTTDLDSMFWQHMRTTLPRNLIHSRNRHLFLHRTEKHPK
jgi:hypothetical protein